MSRPNTPHEANRKNAMVLAIAIAFTVSVSCNGSQHAPNDTGIADGPRDSPVSEASPTSGDVPDFSVASDGPDAQATSWADGKSEFGDVGLGADVLGDVVRGLGDGPDAPGDASSTGAEVHFETPPYTKQDAADAADAADATTVDAMVMPDAGAWPDSNPTPRWLKIASSDRHSCAVRDDRTLWCWGDNRMGAVDNSLAEELDSPTQITTAAPGWQTVAVGSDYTCAVDTDGAIWCWGQFSTSSPPTTKPGKTAKAGYTDVQVGGKTVCALRGAELSCWGNNESGQVGNSITDKWVSENSIPGTWAAVAVGTAHVCAIRTDGTLWCWGSNSAWQLGTSAGSGQNSPTQVGDALWSHVACGPSSTCAVRSDGTLWCWGNDSSGQLGDGNKVGRSLPVQAPGDAWQSVTMAGPSSDSIHTCAIRTDGTMWCWGRNSSGELGDGTTVDRLSPVQVSDRWSQASAGSPMTCAIALDGNLSCWGNNYYGKLGLGFGANRLAPTRMAGEGWAAVATVSSTNSGLRHICATRTDGTLWCWGTGPLGDGTTQSSPVPIQLGGADWAGVAVGQGFSCAIKHDASLWCWGTNNMGQVSAAAPATGTRNTALTPTQLPGSSWTNVSTGFDHACGIKADTTLWCWGSITSTGAMAQVTGSSWDKVSAGGNYTCATKTDQSLWCWGSATQAIGLGNKTADAPTQLEGTWTSVSASLGSTGALKSDGSIWSWGADAYNAKGLVLNGSATPIQGVGTDWSSIGVGGKHRCGIRTGSTLWCWGQEQGGAIGNGLDVNDFAGLPVQVDGTDWASVSAGDWVTCGIRADHSLWCWGYNGNGMLGEEYAWKTVPTRVQETSAAPHG